jgi:putative membrane protein
MPGLDMPEATAAATSAPTDLAQGDLGADRTYLAHERTLMAWTRTSASLISFGFTIYKFFEDVRQSKPHHLLGYRTFSGMLISVGVIALVLATWQHRLDTKELETRFNLKPRHLTTVTAALIGGLGIVGLLAIAFRQ